MFRLDGLGLHIRLEEDKSIWSKCQQNKLLPSAVVKKEKLIISCPQEQLRNLMSGSVQLLYHSRHSVQLW